MIALSDLSLAQKREDLEVPLHIRIRRVQPELVVRVRARPLRSQPDRARLRFAELGAVGFGDEWGGEAKSTRAMRDLASFNRAVRPLLRGSRAPNVSFDFLHGTDETLGDV